MPALATDLISLAQYKAAQGITASTDDVKIELAINRASAAILEWTDRDFKPGPPVPDNPVTKSYIYKGDGFISIDDAREITSVTIDGTSLTVDDWYPEPHSGPPYEWIELAYARGASPEMGFLRNLDRYPVRTRLIAQVTGKFGFATVPLSVEQAAIFTVAAWLAQPDEGLESQSIENYSQSFGNPEGEDAIPSRARQLLKPWQRVRI